MYRLNARALRVVVVVAVFVVATALAPAPAAAGGRPGKILSSSLTTFSATEGLQARVTINPSRKTLYVEVCLAENVPPLDGRGKPVNGHCTIENVIPPDSTTGAARFVDGDALASVGLAVGDTVYLSTRTMTAGNRLISFDDLGARTLPA